MSTSITRSIPTPLATPDEVAEFLRVEREQLSQMRSRGTGPKFIKLGRSIRYRWRDVTDYVDARTTDPA